MTRPPSRKARARERREAERHGRTVLQHRAYTNARGQSRGVKRRSDSFEQFETWRTETDQ